MKCPVRNSPQFKECVVCEKCALLETYREEFRPPGPVGRFVRRVQRLIDAAFRRFERTGP